MTEKCENCKFWNRHENGDAFGDCRRYAPRGGYEHDNPWAATDLEIKAGILECLKKISGLHELTKGQVALSENVELPFCLNKAFAETFEAEWCGEWTPSTSP